MIRLFFRILRRARFSFLKLRIRKLRSAAPRIAGSRDCDTGGLRANYEQYIREVSSAGMAASFECARLLQGICLSRSCKKILDLGSGFSSYVFRQYAKSQPGTVVWSVDDDERWLESTRGFLRESGSDTANLMMLNEFSSGSEGDFDLVFLDLNLVDLRKNYIRLAIERCSEGGAIIFDDVHKPDYLYEVLSRSRDLPVKFFDIRSLTLDSFGRFALLALKNQRINGWS